LRDDGIAVGAQASHAFGKPISQQLNSGWQYTPGMVGAFHCDRGSPCSATASVSVVPAWCFDPSWRELVLFLEPFESCTVGVGHPIQALSDMRSTDARSADIGCFAGVIRFFQVSLYSVEPSEPVLACNLLAKNDRRSLRGNEAVEIGPEVALIIEPSALSCGAEGLAGAGACPNRSIVWPSCKPQGVRPDADACEEMALRESSKVVGSDINNAPLVNDTRRDMPGSDQVAQPLGCIRVEFVIVRSQRGDSISIR